MNRHVLKFILLGLISNNLIFGQEAKSQIDKFVIYGQWVNVKYIDALKQTKSARNSQESCDVIYVNIDTNLNTIINYSFHEGVNCKISKQDINSYYLDWENKILKKVDSKTVLFVSGDKVDTLVYNPHRIGDYNNALLNKIIFSGSYMDLQSGEKVFFTNEGKVSGLRKFKSYIVNNDYFDSALDFDIIKFFNENDVGKGAWQINKDSILTWQVSFDTLKIYSLFCKGYYEKTTDCIELGKGDLIYKLIKMK